MRDVLVINCCIRKEASRTARLLDSFIKALPADCKAEEIDLTRLDLQPLTGSRFEERQALLERGELDDPSFAHAKRFSQADIIVIAAPFWDLAFPALLKIYIEQISVEGITFRTGERGLEGLCRATDMVFLTTRGGIYDEGSSLAGLEMGSRYLDALHVFFGADRYHVVAAEGLDIEGMDAAAILDGACKDATGLAASL